MYIDPKKPEALKTVSPVGDIVPLRTPWGLSYNLRDDERLWNWMKPRWQTLNSPKSLQLIGLTSHVAKYPYMLRTIDFLGDNARRNSRLLIDYLGTFSSKPDTLH